MIFDKRIDLLSYVSRREYETELEDTGYLKSLMFRFTGNLQATGGSTDATIQQDGLLRSILNRIEVIADGDDSFVQSRGYGNYFLRAVMSGSPGVLRTAAVGAGAHPMAFFVVVDMDQLQGPKWAGRIPAKNLTKIKVRTIMGDMAADLITGGDRTYALTGNLEVIALYDSAPPKLGRQGVVAPARRIGVIRQEFTAANPELRITLPPSLWYPQFLLYAVDNAVRDNDIIQRVTVKLGENVIQYDKSWDALQSDNVETFGLELDANGEPPYAGIGVIDFDVDRDADPAKILNTRGLRDNSARLYLDVASPTGTSYVDIFYNALDPSGVGRAGPAGAPRGEGRRLVGAGRG